MPDLIPEPGDAVAQAPSPGISPAQVAAPYAEFGDALDKLAGSIDDVAVNTAHAAAQNAVTRDPDGNLQIKQVPFLIGRASVEYARTAQQSYLAQLDPQIQSKVTEASGQYEGRPQEFQGWGDGFVNKLAGQQPTPELQNAVRSMATRYVGETANGLIVRQQHRELASAQDAITTSQQSIENDLTAMVRGGMDESAPEVQSRMADWMRLQNDRRANPAFGYSESQAAYDNEQFLSGLGGAKFLHTVDAIANDTSVDDKGNPKGGIDAALKFSDSILTDTSLNLTFAQRQQYWVKASTELRALKADQHQDRQDAQADGQSLLFSSYSGAPVDPNDVNGVAERLRKAGAPGAANRFLASFVNKPLNDAFGSQPIPVMNAQVLALKGGNVATSPAEMAIIQRESSGNPGKVNQFGYAGLYQFGAPLLSTLGLYKPGAGENIGTWSTTAANEPGKWSGTFNIPGHPEVQTLHDFLTSPAAQKAAYDQHVTAMDNQIVTSGLDKYEGQTVGGVPITHDGLRAMIHLGGVQGTLATLQSGGKINPADANGKSLLDYAQLGFHPPLAANPANIAWLQANRSATLDSAAGTAWRTVMKDYDEKKIIPNDATFNQISDAARITGDAGLLRQMAADHERMTIMNTARGSSLPVQSAMITELQSRAATGDLSPGQAGVLKDLQQQRDAITKGLTENPISTAVANSSGRFNAPAPLDPTQPGSIAAGLQQRVPIARWASQNWQTGSVGLVDKADAGALTAALQSQAGPQVLGSIAQTLKPDDMKLLLGEDSFRTGVIGMSRSGDPAKMNAAYSFMDTLQKQNPLQFDRQFPDALKDLRAWQSNLAFYPPEEAAKRLMQAYDPAQSAARQASDKAADEALKTVSPQKVVSKFSTGWGPFGTGARPPIAEQAGIASGALKADYDQNYKDGFALTGDPSMADSYAVEKLGLKYSLSPTNGNRVMAYAPEKYYPAIGGSRDWMTTQLDAAVAKQLNVKGAPDLTDALASAVEPTATLMDNRSPAERQYGAQRALVSDETTQRDIANRKPPSYRVILQDPNGRWAAMAAADGTPQRFRFDPAEVFAARAAGAEYARPTIQGLQTPLFGGVTP
jgi:hypothetical protein